MWLSEMVIQTNLGGLLLEFLDGPLVDSTAFVYEVVIGGLHNTMFRMWLYNVVIQTNLSGFFLEFLDGPLVDSTALVDKMARGCRLARVNMANHHDVNVSLFCLFWSHFGLADVCICNS